MLVEVLEALGLSLLAELLWLGLSLQPQVLGLGLSLRAEVAPRVSLLQVLVSWPLPFSLAVPGLGLEKLGPA